MANYNNWYNPALEKLRNDTEKRAYQKRMQLLEEKKKRESIRTVFDIFLNQKARKNVGGDNWFETTFKSIGQFFDNNYAEWFRNPLNGLMNNLSSIGDTLDYAANLIKAPMIAVAKGEDVGERLADAYGLGNNGRVEQNMSELREVLGAKDPGAEIGVSAGMGAITGAEIGTKVAPGIGTLIGGLIGAGIGTINASIDVAVRESGTDNAFWKGTQTVGNTITDMMMEYGVDPANFAGAIGDAYKFGKIKNIVGSRKDIVKEPVHEFLEQDTYSDLLDDEQIKEAVSKMSELEYMAQQDLPSAMSFKKSLNGEQAYRADDILDHVYKSAAETVTKPRLDKTGKPIKVTAEQQRKQFNKKINSMLKAYMDNDKKNFNKYFIDTGAGKYLSDEPEVLSKQLDSIFSTLRHDANMSKVGRIAAFIDRFDSGFAKKLYKGTVPGLTITSAKKAFVKMHNEWEQGLLKVAQQYNKDIIVDTQDESNYTIIEKAARHHYFNRFKKDGFQYEVPKNATNVQMNEIYRSMSDGMAYYYARGNRREYQVLKGLRNSITLSNNVKSINLGEAESSFKKIIKYYNGDARVTQIDFDKAVDKLTDLFYFKNGLDYFQSILFDPTYFKGDFGQVEKLAETIISKAQIIVDEEPMRKYSKIIDSITKKTADFDNFRIDVEKFYSEELHKSIEQLATALKAKQEAINRGQLIKDLEDVLVNGHADAEAIERLSSAIKEELINFENNPIYKNTMSIYSKELGLDLTNGDVLTYLNRTTRDQFVDTHFNTFEESLAKYSEQNKLIREGYQLRASFDAYRKAIGKPELKSTSLIIDDTARKTDMTILGDAKSKYLVDVYMESFRKELKAKGLNPEDVEQITKAAAEDFARIIKGLDSSDLSTYDVMLHFNNILSVGSARLNNFVKYSQIDNPEGFLNDFISGVTKSRKIADSSALSKHSRMITNRLNKLEGILDFSELTANLSMIYPLITDDNQAKLFTNAITDFIFTGKEIPDNISDMLNNVSKITNNGITVQIGPNQLIESLYNLENTVDLEIVRNLYMRLQSAFGGRRFNRGNNPLDAIKSVISTLKFASDSKYKNLTNGVFIDNLIQQTIYETAVEEVSKAAADNLDSVIDEKTAKNIFKEVFKELNVNAETKHVIDDTLTKLYAKRNKLINQLSELETEKVGKLSNAKVEAQIKNTQLQLVNRYKHETNALYKKLNVVTASMFTTNMDEAEFNLKAGKDFAGLVDNLDTLNKADVTTAQIESMKKILMTKINEKMLESDSFKGASNFVSKFVAVKGKLEDGKFIKERDLINNMAIHNGNLYIGNAGHMQLVKSSDLKKFFNNIGGIYKADFIRTGTNTNIKIKNVSIERSINKLKKTTKSLQNWYIKYFNSLINGNDVNFTEQEVKDFLKIFREYDNALVDIRTKLSNEIAENVKEVAKMKYNELKATDFVNRYIDNFERNVDNDNALIKTESQIFEESYNSIVRIGEDKRRIVENTALAELGVKDPSWFEHKFSLPLIDTETSTDLGRVTKESGYENINKKLYQYTIRTNADRGNAKNILIFTPDLTNDYKSANPDLLDADYINGNYINIGGKTLEHNNVYTKFEVDGIEYTMYKYKKDAAQAIINDLVDKGLLRFDADGKGYLEFAGHNAANFDAEIIMNFINENFPNTIVSAEVFDTMWLVRAVMASEGVFKDDASANLSNVFEHWFPDEAEKITKGAHNADVDTYMNYKIMQHIKEKMGDDPAKFFRRTFSMHGQDFLDDNMELFNNLKAIYVANDNGDSILEQVKNITLDDMLNAERVSKLHELRTEVNDDYIKNIYENMINSNESLIELFNNIDSIEKLEDFIEAYDKFTYTYYKYLDYNLEDFNLNKLYESYDKIISKYNDRMTAIYGDSRVMVRLNRDWALDWTLDGFTEIATDNVSTNAFQEIMVMLDANSKEELNGTQPNSLVGDILYKLLDHYNYNKEALFRDFHDIKNWYNYSKRINAHIKFRQDMWNIVDRYADKDNYTEVRQAFQTLMTGLTGYGQDDRASIDNMLTNFIVRAGRTNIESLNNIPAMQKELRDCIAKKRLSLFTDEIFDNISLDDKNEMADKVSKYIDDCIDNLEQYNIATDYVNRHSGAFTILRPAPDRHYIDTMIAAFDTQHNGLLGKYQSIVNNIKAKDVIESGKAQDFDKNGFDYVINSFRDRLRTITDTDKKLNKTVLPTAYIEDANNMSIWQMNSMGYMYTFKSANNYSRQWNEINKSKNAIYKAFGIKYDPNTAGASTYRNIESKFHQLVKRIQEDWGLSTYQMQQCSDISALDDPIYDIEKKVFVDYFNRFITDDNEFYADLKKSIMNYKSKDINAIEDIEKRLAEEKNIENSVKAFIASAYLQGNQKESDPFILSKLMDKTPRQQKLLQYAVRNIDESTKTLNKIFTDVNGNVNYALMYKYLQSNPTLKVAAMIPSDRFNNMDNNTKQFQMSGEFITLEAKDAYDLEGMLTHKPDDGIRYFVIDKHNLMSLKQSIGQATSKKTYTNRQLFENHPNLQKVMALRDTIAKYVLMPIKVLGLQNLGFTVTNAAEAFLKTMTATTGNRFETLKKYHSAISMHRKWSQATGEIAKAIQGSPFYLGKNQWDAMLSELDNSNAIFGSIDIDTMKSLLEDNDIIAIKNKLPSVLDFKNTIFDSKNIPQYQKMELVKKYSKMFTKTHEEQVDAIKRLAERYIKVTETYESIAKTFNKDEFDFVAEFVNSPAAAAEMQSIKKANELNLIGNKARMKNGRLDKIDSPVDRMYKKILFSDWNLGSNNPFRVITPYFNLSLNSDIETINRLALHMDLLDKGFTKSESYNRVLQSFFNYGDKSESELLAELFFPFISFPFRTALFWDEMMEEHPQLIEIFADLVLTNWGKDAQNQYNQTGITKGGLKITPDLSIESGASFLDSLSFAGNAFNILGNRKLNPLLGPLVEGAKQLTTGEANWDYRLSRMPLIGKVMYGQDLVNHLMKGEHHLYDIAPSIFNKVYEQNRYYYRNQGQYAYRSTYSRLYYASGGNRWNSRNRSKAVNMLVRK